MQFFGRCRYLGIRAACQIQTGLKKAVNMRRRSRRTNLGNVLIVLGFLSVILSLPMHHLLSMMLGGLAAMGVGMLLTRS